MRLLTALTAVYLLGMATFAFAQAPAPPVQPGTVFRAGTTLVLVPALVRTKSGEPVFSLTADDFQLSDDDAPQKLSLEQTPIANHSPSWLPWKLEATALDISMTTAISAPRSKRWWETSPTGWRSWVSTVSHACLRTSHPI